MSSSNERNKKIAKNTLYLYFRMLFTMGISLYTSRMILSILGIEDYGIYNVVGGVVAMLGFLNGTLASGTQRFITFQLGKNDFTELKKTFSATLNTHIALTIIILILAETVGLWFLLHKINIPADRKYAALWVYQFSVFTALLSIIQVPYNSSIIAHERMNIYAYVSIVDVCLKLIIVYLLVISNYDKLITYSILILIVNIIVMSIYIVYCRKKYPECRFGLVLDRPLYKSMLIFSGWNIFGCTAFIGATQGVNILLNLFLGPIVNAARGISVQVNNALNSFVHNYQVAVNPQIIKLYATNKIIDLHSLLFQNIKYSFSIMWCLLLPVLLKLEFILQLWLVKVPEHTPLFCRLILVQTLISCMNRPFVTAIHATGKIKMMSLTSGIILLSTLPISYLLLKEGYPSYAPFIIYIFATIGELSINIYLLHRWISLPINKLFKNTFLPALFIIVCSLPIPFIMNYYSQDTFISFFIIVASSVILVIISIYYIALNKENQNEIKEKIRRVIKNIKEKIWEQN